MSRDLLVPLYRTARIRHLYLKNRMKEMGLSGNMNMILMKIADGPCESQDALALEVLSDKASVSRECGALEKMGLIETVTDPSNRRKRILSLTGKGEKILGEIRKINSGIAEVLLSDIPEDEKAVLSRCMEEMESNAEELWEELTGK